MGSLKIQIEALKDKLVANQLSHTPSSETETPTAPPAEARPPPTEPRAPECPICFERMIPPRKIFYCSNGHHVCGDCRPKLERCYCRGDITGRAIDMEKF